MVQAGVDMLLLSAMNQHVDTMAVLADAGVVDNGEALISASCNGRELSAKFLLQQRKGDEAAYVNYRSIDSLTPLIGAVGYIVFSCPSPRIVRLLVDAGADTKSANPRINQTPLATASRMLREKKINGKDATEDQLHRLEGVRRLLLRVEAVHAVSFLWPVDAPPRYRYYWRGCKQDDEGFDPSDYDAADLEAECSHTQGALDCPVQVGGVMRCWILQYNSLGACSHRLAVIT